MPTIPSLISDLLHNNDAYPAVELAIAVLCSFLLALSGLSLGAAAGKQKGGSYGLLFLVSLLSLAVGLPFYIPYPHYDFLVPGVPLFLLWVVLGLLLCSVPFASKAKRPGWAALCAALSLAIIPLAGAGTMGLRGLTSSAVLLWTSYPVPAVLGGALLAWAFATGRNEYGSYLIGWGLVVAMVLLPLYIGQLDLQQYAISTAQGQGAASASTAVSEAERSQAIASLIYTASILVLLILPFLLGRIGRRRSPRLSTAYN